MNSPRPLLVALAAVVVCASPVPADDPAGASIPTVPSPIPGYLPDPFAGDGTVTEDGTRVFVAGGVSLRLSALDDAGRWEWIRRTSGAHADPFGARGDEDPGYLALLLELRNDSAGVIAFNPDRIWLRGDGAQIERPLDLATMQSAYRMHDRELPPAYERAGAALLQGDTLLSPGDERVGLLVFRRLEGRTRAFTVEIPLTTGSGDVIEWTAAWLDEDRLRKKRAKHEKREAKRRARSREE